MTYLQFNRTAIVVLLQSTAVQSTTLLDLLWQTSSKQTETSQRICRCGWICEQWRENDATTQNTARTIAQLNTDVVNISEGTELNTTLLLQNLWQKKDMLIVQPTNTTQTLTIDHLHVNLGSMHRAIEVQRKTWMQLTEYWVYIPCLRDVSPPPPPPHPQQHNNEHQIPPWISLSLSL